MFPEFCVLEILSTATICIHDRPSRFHIRSIFHIQTEHSISSFFFVFFKNFCVKTYVLREPRGTQVIVGSMNMGYITDTARNRTHNLFRPKCKPIPLGHSHIPHPCFTSHIPVSHSISQFHIPHPCFTFHTHFSHSTSQFHIPHPIFTFHIPVSYPKSKFHIPHPCFTFHIPVSHPKSKFHIPHPCFTFHIPVSYSTSLFHIPHPSFTSQIQVSHSTSQFHIPHPCFTFHIHVSHSTSQFHIPHPSFTFNIPVSHPIRNLYAWIIIYSTNWFNTNSDFKCTTRYGLKNLYMYIGGGGPAFPDVCWICLFDWLERVGLIAYIGIVAYTNIHILIVTIRHLQTFPPLQYWILTRPSCR